MHRLGQEDQNNFLTDQMSRFWLTSGVRAPGSAQKRHLEAPVDRFLPDPSADARTPQNGVLFAHFAPRSLHTHWTARPGNKARDPLEQNEYRHLPQCDLAIAGLNNAHCDRNSLVSVDTDDGAAQGALGAAEGPWAEKYPTKQESDR